MRWRACSVEVATAVGNSGSESHLHELLQERNILGAGLMLQWSVTDESPLFVLTRLTLGDDGDQMARWAFQEIRLIGHDASFVLRPM